MCLRNALRSMYDPRTAKENLFTAGRHRVHNVIRAVFFRS